MARHALPLLLAGSLPPLYLKPWCFMLGVSAATSEQLLTGSVVDAFFILCLKEPKMLHLPARELRTQVQSSRRFWHHAPHMLRVTLIARPGRVRLAGLLQRPSAALPRYKAVFSPTGTKAGSLVMTALLFVH